MPKGDFSDDANADKPEDANAELEVDLSGEEMDCVACGGDLGATKLLNGEVAEALAKPEEDVTSVALADGEATDFSVMDVEEVATSATLSKACC